MVLEEGGGKGKRRKKAMKTVEEYTEASLNLKCESETHSF